MKPKFRKALAALLAVICALCLGRTALQLVQYRQGDETYAQAEELAGLPDLSDLPVVDFTGGSGSVSSSASTDGAGEAPEEVPVWQDPYAQALKDMDFSALRQQNPDVLGWILIPGTRVSYPVVQGTDNSYYLDHTWRGGKNSVGAIFMECRNSSDLSDFNTIIYGHRMNNRSMFGTLSQYKSRSYWQAHPYVYLTDDSGTHRYEIFAAGEVSVDSDVYRLGLRSDSSRQTDAQQNLRYDRKLFVQPDKEVRPGDTVTVSRFGRFLDPSPSVQKFEAVGEPLLYQTHREVFLKAVDLA